jgi:alanine racemase
VPERALARVSTGAIERNCALLRGRARESGAELCAVVKAGGYGHGAVESARAALRGGATWLAVATAGEAAELRRAAGGLEGARLLVMGALTGDDLDVALAAGADVAAWTPELLDAAAARGGARVHVKLDSGMGRLGTKDPGEALALCERAAADERLELVAVWTHFATADEPGDDHFPRQLERFTALKQKVNSLFPGVVAHAANSAATLRDPAAHFDLVRCGVAIYGLDPFQRDPADHGLEPALELHSYVAAVKRFEPGESAGYGRRWTATEPTWLAVVPIGYGDGWRRALTNDADVLVRGRRHPLVGTVSMDNITVELGPETDVRVGDEVVLIGAQGGERILAEEVAARLGTINYEVTCGIGRRVRYLHEE